MGGVQGAQGGLRPVELPPQADGATPTPVRNEPAARPEVRPEARPATPATDANVDKVETPATTPTPAATPATAAQPTPAVPGAASNVPLPNDMAAMAPEQVALVDELAGKVLDETSRLEARGLRVDPNTAATGVVARTTRSVPLREVAAAAYNVEPARVSDAQIANVRSANPQLTADDVPQDAEVRLDTTPAGADLAERHLQIARTQLDAGVLPLQGADPQAMRQALDQRLTEVQSTRTAARVGERLFEAEQTARRQLTENRPQNVQPAFDLVRRELDASVRAGRLTPEHARLLETRLTFTEAGAAQATGARTSEIYRNTVRDNEEMARTVARSGGMGGGMASAMQMQRNQAYIDQNRQPTLDAITRQTDGAIARLEELRTRTPEAGPQVDAMITQLRNDAARNRALVHLATRDRAAAEREILPAELTRDGPLTRADTTINVGADGNEQGVMGALFSQTTRMDAMSPDARARATQRIAALPEAERARAMESLVRLGDTYASADDVGGLNMVRQVLNETATRGGDNGLRVQADMLEARYATRIGNFAGARTALERSDALARTLPGDRGRDLRTQSILGLVALHRSEAADGGDGARGAADRLRTLREGLERDTANPLSRDQMARMGILEAQTYLSQSQSVRALESLRTLERYNDVPWTRDAVRQFQADNTEAGITAAIKVGLRSANAGSIAETAAYTIGGGVVGAGVGFALGGPPGAGVGFLVGSAAGGLTSNAVSVARNWDSVTQAFNTGLTDIGWGETAANAAFVGLNAVSAAAPVGGMARLGAYGGVRAFANPAEVVQALERGALALGRNATREQLEAQARQFLVHELAEGSMRFGGRTLPAAGIAAAVGPMAVEYGRIASMPAGAERDEAMRRFQSNIAQGGLVALATVGAAAMTARIAARGARRWPVDPAAGELGALRTNSLETPGALGTRGAGELALPSGVMRLPTTPDEIAAAQRQTRLNGVVDSELERFNAAGASTTDISGLLARTRASLSAADPSLTPAEASALSARTITARLAERGIDDPRVRQTLYDQVVADRAVAGLPAVDERAASTVAATLTRARERALAGDAAAMDVGALTRTLQQGGLSAENAALVAGRIRGDALERIITSRLATIQASRGTPLTDAEIRSATETAARDAGLTPTQAVDQGASLVGRQGFNEWVRLQLPQSAWTPEMRRNFALQGASPTTRAELAQLTPAEFSRVFGNRVMPSTAEPIAALPGFASFARNFPDDVRYLVQASSILDAPSVYRHHIAAGRTPEVAFAQTAQDMRRWMPTIGTDPALPNYYVARRVPGSPPWVPAVSYIPMPALDHNGAFYTSGRTPGRALGSDWVPSEFPELGSIPLSRTRVNGQPLTTLQNTLVFGGHGSPFGISGMNPARVAQHIADEVARQPRGAITSIILDACSQRDMRGVIVGAGSGERIRAAVQAELTRRGYPPVNVLAADRPGVTYGGGTQSEWMPIHRDRDSGELRLGHRRFPSVWTEADNSRPYLPMEYAILGGTVAGGGALGWLIYSDYQSQLEAQRRRTPPQMQQPVR